MVAFNIPVFSDLISKMKPQQKQHAERSESQKPTKFPTAYINHGGGPMPLLGQQPVVVSDLQSVSNSLPTPTAIVIISAHFETDQTTIMTHPTPPIYYDYSGFPASNKFKYAAPSSPEIIQKIKDLLRASNIEHREDSKRGYDHGAFVPLMIMYPKGNIPVVSVSQPSSYDPVECIKLGEALSPLRENGVLILGSGSSFHNFNAFFRQGDDHTKKIDMKWAKEWNQWLRRSCTELKGRERERELERWEGAPRSRFAHPREDHLCPLFVVAGAAGDDVGKVATKRGDGKSTQMFSLDVSQFVFGG